MCQVGRKTLLTHSLILANCPYEMHVFATNVVRCLLYTVDFFRSGTDLIALLIFFFFLVLFGVTS